jgi:hypothetical protein
VYSPDMQKEFRIRKKKFLLSTMFGGFREQYFENIKCEAIYRPRMNMTNKNFWLSLTKFSFLRIWRICIMEKNDGKPSFNNGLT